MLGKGLLYYWRNSAAVVATVAVCTAVLTGALTVGDSIRSSLERMALERLGNIDFALVSGNYFSDSLASRLDAELRTHGVNCATVATVVSHGSASHAQTAQRTSDVTAVGVSESFLELFAEVAAPWAELLGHNGDADVKSTLGFTPAILNSQLAHQVGAKIGDDVLITLARHSEIPRTSLLGHRDPGDAVRTLRVTVIGVIDDRGLGRFALNLHQGRPSNLYLGLTALQDAIGQPGKMNTLLLDVRVGSTVASRTLAVALRRAVTLDDLGLRIEIRSSALELTSHALVLTSPVVATFVKLVRQAGLEPRPHLTYLLNRMAVGERAVPYSMATAIDPSHGPNSEGLLQTDAEPLDSLGVDEIAINRWAAEDLGVSIGENLNIEYYTVGGNDHLQTTRATLRVAAIVEQVGLAADRSLVPMLAGVYDAKDMAAWEPPFPVDFRQIRKQDEEYWDTWGVTPKAFVSLTTGRRLWNSRFGDTTAVRVALPADLLLPRIVARRDDFGSSRANADFAGSARARNAVGIRDELAEQLSRRLEPSKLGLRFEPIRAAGLSASTGATDFTGLFLGFSSFLILAATLLMALLFSLGVEQRRHELGLLLALGHPRRRVFLRFLLEGACLAAVGAAVGVILAIGYAWSLINGLSTWWRPAVGTTDLQLAIVPTTILLGYGCGIVVSLVAMALALRRLTKRTPLALLSGRDDDSVRSPSSSLRRIRNGACMLAIVVLVASGFVHGASLSPVLFFATGTLLLAAALGTFALWSQTIEAQGKAVVTNRWSLAMSGVTRRPGRSSLIVTLIACASFVLVAVATNRREAPDEAGGRDLARAEPAIPAFDRLLPKSSRRATIFGSSRSATGGYALIAESELPLYQRLDHADDRFDLGMSQEIDGLLAQVDVMHLRLRPGDDTSCLNLFRPTSPRIVGVPRRMIERGGFRFADTLAPSANPWQLLGAEDGSDVIPAIGDAEATRWILHLGIGDTLAIVDGRGSAVKLRLVATLANSSFQSELLIGEDAFLAHFPDDSGFRFFLIDTLAQSLDKVTVALESSLHDYGFDVVTSSARLAGFHAVANTYLETFRVLGGFGMLLGTVGLGIVLLRHAMERRGELATMRAVGFSNRTLLWMMTIESSTLLVVGLAIGTVSASIASLPSILATSSVLPWMQLGTTLAALLMVGLGSATTAATIALRAPILKALKAD